MYICICKYNSGGNTLNTATNNMTKKTTALRKDVEYLIKFNNKLVDLNTTVFVLTLQKTENKGNVSYSQNEGIFTTPDLAEQYASDNGFYEMEGTKVLIYDVELNKGVVF